MMIVGPFNEYDLGARKILTVLFVNYSPRPRRIYTSFVRNLPFASLLSIVLRQPRWPFVRRPIYTLAEYA